MASMGRTDIPQTITMGGSTMRHALLALVLGAMLLFGTQMAFAHGGIAASPLGHTVTNPMTDLPDNDAQNN